MPEDCGEIFKRDTMGRIRVPRARREMLLDELERSGGSAAQFANYVGIKYSTLASWIQKRRKRVGFKKSLVEPREGGRESSKSNGRWVEAIVEKNPAAQTQESSLRLHFRAGAYCEISNGREAVLAAELLGRLGAKGC
jgi:transposase